MIYNKTVSFQSVTATISRFESQSPVKEFHVMLQGTDPSLCFELQLLAIRQAVTDLTENGDIEGKPVFARYFLSDIANQTDLVNEKSAFLSQAALSVIQQPPLNGTKIALWICMQTDVRVDILSENYITVTHNDYTHVWGSGCYQASAVEDSHRQTVSLFETYMNKLQQAGGTLAQNCMRTWLFVQNV
ncbi:MAG: Rid family hydrolase, partial [Bacteroidales bacterium]